MGCVVVVVVLLRCCGSLSVPYKTSTQSFNLAPRTVNKKDGHNNISGNVSYTSMRNLEKQCRPNMLLKITLHVLKFFYSLRLMEYFFYCIKSQNCTTFTIFYSYGINCLNYIFVYYQTKPNQTGKNNEQKKEKSLI